MVYKSKEKAYYRAYYHANAEKLKAYQKTYRQANAEKIKAHRQAHGQKLKETILSHYSGGIPKCACCGEQNMAFLSIDHVEGGGNKQMRKLKRRGNGFYRWLRNNGYPSGYRVLCMNCNSALGLRGHCPHGVLPDGQKSRLEQSQSYGAVYMRKRRQKLKHDVLVYYSGGLPACSCCGEKHDEFLSIDHINDDGADHRRMIGGWGTIYRWLINNDFPSGFQVLCMNCNFAKGHSSDGCPHKKPAEP
jgi:ribosome-associated translation inhibitor RaiA